MQIKPIDIISRSLSLIGILAADTRANAHDLQLGRDIFREMLDTFSVNGQFAPFTLVRAFPLEVGKFVYTIGEGNNDDGEPADLVAPRPSRIISGAIILPGGSTRRNLIIADETEYHTRVIIEYDPATRATTPSLLWLQRTFPHGTIRLTESPYVGLTMEIYYSPALDVEADFLTVMNMDDGYSELFIYNLAMRLCTHYGKEPAPSIVALASQTYNDMLSRSYRAAQADSPYSSESTEFSIHSGPQV